MKQVVLIVLLAVLLGGCGAVDKIEETTKGLENLDYKTYEGRISGSFVTTAASLYEGRDISIYVRTGVNQKGYYAKTAGCYMLDGDVAVPAQGCQYVTESEMKNAGDPNRYVNSFGSFNGTLYKNKDGVVKLLVMEQKPVQ